jgi:hypothetical protein
MANFFSKARSSAHSASLKASGRPVASVPFAPPTMTAWYLARSPSANVAAVSAAAVALIRS